MQLDRFDYLILETIADEPYIMEMDLMILLDKKVRSLQFRLDRLCGDTLTGHNCLLFCLVIK